MYRLTDPEIRSVPDALCCVAKESKFKWLVIAEFSLNILTAILAYYVGNITGTGVFMFVLSCFSFLFPIGLLIIYINMKNKIYKPAVFIFIKIILIITLVISIISDIMSVKTTGILSAIISLVISITYIIATICLFSQISNSYEKERMMSLDESTTTIFKVLAVVQIVAGVFSFIHAITVGLILYAFLLLLISALGAVVYYSLYDISETYNGAVASCEVRIGIAPGCHCPRCNYLMGPDMKECPQCHYIRE